MSSDDYSFGGSNYEQIEVPADMPYLDIIQMLDTRSTHDQQQTQQQAALHSDGNHNTLNPYRGNDSTHEHQPEVTNPLNIQVAPATNGQRSILEQNYENGVADLQNLLNFSYDRIPDPPKKKKKSRGPPKSTVQVKLYHLPGGSEKPIFTKFDDPVVVLHFNNGYGYASGCYDTTKRKIKKMSIPIRYTEEQLKLHMLEVFTKLVTPFYFYKVTQGSEIQQVSVRVPEDMIKYQGVIVLSNDADASFNRGQIQNRRFHPYHISNRQSTNQLSSSSVSTVSTISSSINRFNQHLPTSSITRLYSSSTITSNLRSSMSAVSASVTLPTPTSQRYSSSSTSSHSHASQSLPTLNRHFLSSQANSSTPTSSNLRSSQSTATLNRRLATPSATLTTTNQRYLISTTNTSLNRHLSTSTTSHNRYLSTSSIQLPSLNATTTSNSINSSSSTPSTSSIVNVLPVSASAIVVRPISNTTFRTQIQDNHLEETEVNETFPDHIVEPLSSISTIFSDSSDDELLDMSEIEVSQRRQKILLNNRKHKVMNSMSVRIT